MRCLLVFALICGACADPTGLGVASSTAHATAASATVIVVNVADGLGGAARVWSIEIGETPPGTDCKNRGDALIVLDVYTSLSSAPRGTIRVEVGDPPPMIYPAVYPHYANGFAIDGELVIDAASTTRILGSFSGQANLAGANVLVEATFDAPTCGL